MSDHSAKATEIHTRKTNPTNKLVTPYYVFAVKWIWIVVQLDLPYNPKELQ
jgi:hypothetical protein